MSSLAEVKKQIIDIGTKTAKNNIQYTPIDYKKLCEGISNKKIVYLIERYCAVLSKVESGEMEIALGRELKDFYKELGKMIKDEHNLALEYKNEVKK